MREAEIRTVGEHTYELKPLATSAMLKLMTRLVKVLGPTVGALDDPKQFASDGLEKTLTALASRFDEDDVLSVCAMLAEHTQIIDGDKKLRLGGTTGAQWETHFAGDPVGLLSWLGVALEVNFGPLASWLAKASKVKAPPAPVAAPAR